VGHHVPQEDKGLSLAVSSWLGCASELAGLVSALIGGYIADRYLPRPRGVASASIAMALMSVAIFFFSRVPKASLDRDGVVHRDGLLCSTSRRC
jgi:sugar phosphate permease